MIATSERGDALRRLAAERGIRVTTAPLESAEAVWVAADRLIIVSDRLTAEPFVAALDWALDRAQGDAVVGEALFRGLGYRTPDPALDGLDVDLALMLLVARIEDHPDREAAAARAADLAARRAELVPGWSAGDGDLYSVPPATSLDPMDAALLGQDDE